jgi:proteasome lid subunit RPN8/RPN11
MIEHCRKCSPEEACGVLVGVLDGNGDYQISQIVLVENVDHDPMHFSLNVKEQLAAQKMARKSGQTVLGVFHSHPRGPVRLTKEDIRLAMDPDAVWTLVANTDEGLLTVKSYKIVDGVATEIEQFIV